MNLRAGEQALIAAAIGYLGAVSWAMSNISFDIWGALVTGPLLMLVGVLGVRRMFGGDLQPLQRVMWLGLAAKMVGALARYWVAFDAYGGSTDAERYHLYAKEAAGKVWSGEAPFSSVLPSGTGTEFIERFTALVYTLTGASKLAGFLFFSWLSFWGLAWFVRAACLAVPDLERRRYAALCVLAPSLVYWPSSIGKEAWMMLWLGIATYGIARLFAGREFFRSFLISAAGLGGAAFVRPHMAGLWLAGLLPALLAAVFRRRNTRDHRRGLAIERLLLVMAIGVVAVALSAAGSATVRYLNARGDVVELSGTSITDILTETTRRTEQAGSIFTPPTINGPTDWPYASLRTLTRPLIIEVDGLAQLISALEMSVFLVICLLTIRRLLHLPKLVLTNPFVAFAMTSLFLGGLAYSSFANLGVLTRQKSLLLPLMLLIPCLPRRSRTRAADEVVVEDHVALGGRGTKALVRAT